MTQTKAALWRAKGQPVTVEEVELRPLGPKDVLVRIAAANACITDAIMIGLTGSDPGFEMPMPQVLGHGGAGTVEAVGPEVHDVKPGERVLASAQPLCGSCYHCLHARPDQCAEIVMVGPSSGRAADGTDVYPNANLGGYSGYAIVPSNQVTPLDTSVPDDELALLADGVGGGLGAVFNVAPVPVGASVAVFGCGATGLGYVQGARVAGARQVIAVDPIQHRREFALELGATHGVDPAEGDAVEQVHELTPDVGGFNPRGVDFAFEASGEAKGFEQAWAATRSGGDVILASVPRDQQATVTFPAIPLAMFGKTIHSSQWGWINIRRDLPHFVRLIEDGSVQVRPLVTQHFPLERINDAFQDAIAYRSIGTIMTPWS